ncbi:hypothetical protein TGPRC2_249450 [Toxoplasma gondii TgCatPRC2]|uniref:Uncharacterized protein n=1 Tax=Toxoplasma gondii TgCatPRC2 TaxID=1130821 RepID=A0A151H006_TOXGO|nr:hypothetical protein TGPRC2_249450 [Toxoplasma gondii TgCatPRC2]
MSRPLFPHGGRRPEGPALHQFAGQVPGSRVSGDVRLLVPSANEGVYAPLHFVQVPPGHLSPPPAGGLSPESVGFLASHAGVYGHPHPSEARAGSRLHDAQARRHLGRENCHFPELSLCAGDQERLVSPHGAARPPTHPASLYFPPNHLPFRACTSPRWEGHLSKSPTSGSAFSHPHSAEKHERSEPLASKQWPPRSLARGSERLERGECVDQEERQSPSRNFSGSSNFRSSQAQTAGREQSGHRTDSSRERDHTRRGASHSENQRSRGCPEKLHGREGGDASLSREPPDDARSRAQTRGTVYGEGDAFHGREKGDRQRPPAVSSGRQNALRGQPPHVVSAAAAPPHGPPHTLYRAPAAVHLPGSHLSAGLPSSPPASLHIESTPHPSLTYGVHTADPGAAASAALPAAFAASAAPRPQSSGFPPGSGAAVEERERMGKERQSRQQGRSGDVSGANKRERESSCSLPSQQSTQEETACRASRIYPQVSPFFSGAEGGQSRIPASSAEPSHSLSRVASGDRESRSRSESQRRRMQEESGKHRPYRFQEARRGEGIERAAVGEQGREEQPRGAPYGAHASLHVFWQSRDKDACASSRSDVRHNPDGFAGSSAARREGKDVSSSGVFSSSVSGALEGHSAASASPAPLASSCPVKKLRTAVCYPLPLPSPLDYLHAAADGVSPPQVSFHGSTASASALTPLRSLRPEQRQLSLTFMLLRPLPDPLSRTLEQHRLHYMVADASASVVLVLPLPFLRRRATGEKGGEAERSGEEARNSDRTAGGISGDEEEKERLIREVKGVLQPGDVIHMTGAVTSWSAKGEMVITVPLRKGPRDVWQGRQEGNEHSYDSEGSLEVLGRFSFPFVTEPDMSCMFTAVAPEKGERGWSRGGGQVASEFAAFVLKGEEKETLSREIGLAASGASIPCEDLGFPVADPLACLGPPPPFFVLLSP